MVHSVLFSCDEKCKYFEGVAHFISTRNGCEVQFCPCEIWNYLIYHHQSSFYPVEVEAHKILYNKPNQQYRPCLCSSMHSGPHIFFLVCCYLHPSISHLSININSPIIHNHQPAQPLEYTLLMGPIIELRKGKQKVNLLLVKRRQNRANGCVVVLLCWIDLWTSHR